MTQQQITDIQRRIGATPDGFWGPQSIAQCKRHLLSLMPILNPWPRSDRASVEAFFGKPGDESNLVPFEFPFPTYYDGKRVLKSRCHRKVKDSLLRVLSCIGERHGEDRGIMEEAEDYGGIYNFRPKRGASSLSLHSWGIAIDLDADDNAFRDSWPVKADMPLEIMEAFAREGWTSAGAWWGYDGMHHQATCP
jgi:hypothetical protein